MLVKIRTTFWNVFGSNAVAVVLGACLFYAFAVEALAESYRNYNSIAMNSMRSGNYDDAIKFSHLAVTSLSDEVEYREIEVARLYDMISRAYYGLSESEQAEAYLRRSIEQYLLALASLAEKRNSSERHAGLIYGKLGSAYQKLGNLDEARRYFEKELVHAENVHGKDSMGTVNELKRLGQFYTDLGDFDKAESYVLNAYRISTRHKESYGNFEMVILGAAEFYKEFGRYDIAEKYYESAKKEINNTEEPIRCLSEKQYLESLADLYLREGRLEERNTAMRRLVALSCMQKYTRSLIEIYAELAVNEHEVGNVERGKDAFVSAVEIYRQHKKKCGCDTEPIYESLRKAQAIYK